MAEACSVVRPTVFPTDPIGPSVPVFSGYQTEVIIYGNDPLDYVQHDFGSQSMASSRLNLHSLELWTLFAFDMGLEWSTMRFGRPANRSHVKR